MNSSCLNERNNLIHCTIGEKEYLTVEEACEWLGIGKSTLEQYRDMGLKIIKPNKSKAGRILLKKQHIREFLDTFVE